MLSLLTSSAFSYCVLYAGKYLIHTETFLKFTSGSDVFPSRRIEDDKSSTISNHLKLDFDRIWIIWIWIPVYVVVMAWARALRNFY